MLLERCLSLSELLDRRSHFLFGPRATGKSTLVRQQLQGKVEVIDLLDRYTFMRHHSDPSLFARQVMANRSQVIVVDEIQLIPELLNDVHRLIEQEGARFLLLGSSTRKLRRAGVNLLAGRAFFAKLFPLVRKEIPNFDLDRYLRYGGLPEAYLGDDRGNYLHAYLSGYLREEVATEGVVRNLPSFSRFLRAIALTNGEVVNFTKVANDCQVAVSTVRGYLQILEDTLLASLLPVWTASQKRKSISAPKVYLFDTGVARILAGVESLDRNSNLYGKAFEHFIWMELRSYLAYRNKEQLALCYWRTKHGQEVDFVIGNKLAIEVKATTSVTNRDFKGLHLLAEEGAHEKFYLVSHDPIATRNENFYAMPWTMFLDELWQDRLL